MGMTLQARLPLRIAAAFAGVPIVLAASAGPATAQQPAPTQLSSPSAASARVGSPRHVAAQAAGTNALHFCSGYFGTANPRPLVAATLSTNGAPTAPANTRMEIDEQARTVSVWFNDAMSPRMAVARPGLSCTLLPIGAGRELGDSLIRPAMIAPDLDQQRWPMGDGAANTKLPGKRQAAVEAAIDEAFKDGAGRYKGATWGVVVIKGGKIVAERYQHDFGPHNSARTNSMCKSLTGSLVGVGVQKGLLDIHAKGVLAAWRRAGDPRGNITINDLMHMNSGLYSESAGDRQFELYQSGAPVIETSATPVVDSLPGTRFVYSGSDTVLTMRALHEKIGDDAAFLGFPYKELLWKIGMTRTVVEADINNDFLSSGQCWSTARDFGRLGMLLLADGQSNGEQILPKGWAKYVSTPAPAQPNPVPSAGGTGYGAQFWLFGGAAGLPSDAFAAYGARGQYAMIIPSQDLVIVRRGFDRDSSFEIAQFSADVARAAAP